MAYDLEIGTGDAFAEALVAEWDLTADAADDLAALVTTVFASDGIARIEDFAARAESVTIAPDVEVVVVQAGGSFSSSGQDLVIRVEGPDPVDITAPAGDGTRVMVFGGEGDDTLRVPAPATTTESAALPTSSASLSAEEGTDPGLSGALPAGAAEPDAVDDRDYVAGLLARVGTDADCDRALDYWSAVLEDGRLTRAQLDDLLGLSAEITPAGESRVDDFDFF